MLTVGKVDRNQWLNICMRVCVFVVDGYYTGDHWNEFLLLRFNTNVCTKYSIVHIYILNATNVVRPVSNSMFLSNMTANTNGTKRKSADFIQQRQK